MDTSKRIVMHHCQHSHDSSSVSQTLDELDFERGLWHAAQYGDLNRLQSLLDKGYNVNQEDSAGYTPLHYATRNKHFNVSQVLLNNGADVNARTRAGQATPLHRACMAGDGCIVDLLIAAGADLNAVDNDGKNCLHRAVEGQHRAIIKALLTKTPYLAQHQDHRGNTPYKLAANMGMSDAFIS